MVSHSEMKWHYETVPKKTKKALNALSAVPWLGDKWYLAGGTALALSVGNRVSVDLDFFTTEREFDLTSLKGHLSEFGPDWTTTIEEKNTLYGELLGAKVSFIAYPFFVPKKAFVKHGSLNVLQPEDIAVMKVVAISQRGKKRDFFDLYWYAKNREPLTSVIARLDEQYPSVRHNHTHMLTALVYFEDAEADVNPVIMFDASWKQVKEFFESEIPAIVKEIVHLK